PNFSIWSIFSTRFLPVRSVSVGFHYITKTSLPLQSPSISTFLIRHPFSASARLPLHSSSTNASLPLHTPSVAASLPPHTPSVAASLLLHSSRANAWLWLHYPSSVATRLRQSSP
ncbi:uncharacterized protein Tco025E_10318, partial [Trypanosoma conorhini]